MSYGEVGKAMAGLHDAAQARARRVHAIVGYIGFALFVCVVGVFIYWCFNPDFIRFENSKTVTSAGESEEQRASRWRAEIRIENDRRVQNVWIDFGGGGPLKGTTSHFYTGEIVLKDAIAKLPGSIMFGDGGYYFGSCDNYLYGTHDKASEDQVLGTNRVERRAFYLWIDKDKKPHGSMPNGAPNKPGAIGDAPKTGMTIDEPRQIGWNSWGSYAPGEPPSPVWIMPDHWSREQVTSWMSSCRSSRRDSINTGSLGPN